MTTHNTSFRLASGLAVLALAASTLLTGCGMNSVGSASHAAATTLANVRTMGGMVHGGNQPVTGATITLWAAGTTGTYGTGATKIATTTSDSNGGFTFDDATTGASPCTTGQYLYITATGGNPGAGINNSSAMMVALPTPCGTATAGTLVWINEVTTVAAVTALQQFMSINTSATVPYAGNGTAPWTIGAPSTNTVGLANAFSMVPLLASTSNGTSANTFPANTITPNNSTTPQLFTTTIAPEISKINGIADVLAVCINDTTGNLCTGSAGVLTLTSITTGTTNATPVDTIQAAYNMATLANPKLYSASGSNKYWTNSSSTTTYLATLWADISATAPFIPYTATTPTDTTVTLNWKCVGSTSGTTGTLDATSIAVDGLGNIWIGAGTGVTSNYVTQFQPNGIILQDIVTVNLPGYNFTYYTSPTASTTAAVTANPTQALGYGRPISNIAIDTNNNAWFNAYGVASPGTIATELAGITAQVTQSGTATGFITGSANGTIAIDGSNNLFMSNIPTAGRYYLSMLSNASAWTSAYEGVARGTQIFNGLAIDSNGYLWGFGSSCTTGETINRVNAAGLIAQTESNVVLASNCAFQGAGDANGNMWSSDGTNLDYITTTTAGVNVAFTGGSGTGLASVNAVALDGAANVWAVNKGTTGTAGSAGVAEFATNGTAGTAVLLSPASTSSMGFGSTSGVYLGAPEGIALDPSGNVWFGTTGGSYLYVTVGIAAPTRTPISANYAHIGTKP